MSSEPLIRKLLKILCQALRALSTSSAQRLHIFVSYLLCFVNKIRGIPRRNPDSRSSVPECPAVLTSASSAPYPQVTLPLLPVYNQHITSATAASGTQDVVSFSVHPPTMSDPRIPQQFANTISSNVDRTTFNFKPIGVGESRCDSKKRPRADKSLQCNRIPQLMRDFPNRSCPWLTGDWRSCIHPEGALYFYNDRRRTFIEANMDAATSRWIDRCVDELHNLACTKSVNLEDDINLFVQLEAELDGNVSCGYYFVDHAARTLFWLHDHNTAMDDIFRGLRGISDPSHIGYALESEYWAHCERYPNHNINLVKLLKELRELVTHARAVIITSDGSLSPFDADELAKIQELIKDLQVNAEDDGSQSPYSTCVIAKFMQFFSSAKFFNFYGLPCARVDADQSVYTEDTGFLSPLTNSLTLVLDAILFRAPQAHFKDLRRVFMDESGVNMARWKDFNKNLVAEWNGVTIYSTVMLAVDVTFLAVPNVNIVQSQSVGVIATYISIIFVTGSVIISLLLARQIHWRYNPASEDGEAGFLLRILDSFFGMKALATVYCLPYAMLMWGIIFFVIGFLYNVFKSTTPTMLALVISGSVTVTMFIVGFIWAARKIMTD